MNHLLLAVESALQAGNHYAALALALALPDICGWVQDPDVTTGARYVAWFEKYLQSKYTNPASALIPNHIFLNGSDCYALRCAYLHEGRDDITDQRAQQVLDAFHFVVPPKGWKLHCNQFINTKTNTKTLQLQVDIFCREVIEGVKQFLFDISSNPDAVKRLNQLLLIRNEQGHPI